MPGLEQERNAPLTVDNLREAIQKGLIGTEIFWQQFDRFTITLRPPILDPEEGLPHISLSAEFHFPPNTPTPVIQNGELGNIMHESLQATINKYWDELFLQWMPGYSGGNSRGWDVNFYSVLGEDARMLEIPPDDNEVLLFDYNKPKDEAGDRALGSQIHTQTFNLEDGDGLIISPEGVISAADLRKARKARDN